MELNNISEGLTFDDVLLVPAYSEILPAEADTRTRFSRNIDLNICGNKLNDRFLKF